MGTSPELSPDRAFAIRASSRFSETAIVKPRDVLKTCGTSNYRHRCRSSGRPDAEARLELSTAATFP
jgi:hypothetical protein